jgi:hypothetical protein
LGRDGFKHGDIIDASDEMAYAEQKCKTGFNENLETMDW